MAWMPATSRAPELNFYAWMRRAYGEHRLRRAGKEKRGDEGAKATGGGWEIAVNSSGNKSFKFYFFTAILMQASIAAYSTALAFKISRHLADAVIFIFAGFAVACLVVLSVDSEKFYMDASTRDEKYCRQVGYLFLGFAYVCIFVSILSLIIKLNPPEYAAFSVLVSMTGIFFSLTAYRVYNRLDRVLKYGSEAFWTALMFVITLAGAYKVVSSGEYVRAPLSEVMWVLVPFAVIFYAWLAFILHHSGFLKIRRMR